MSWRSALARGEAWVWVAVLLGLALLGLAWVSSPKPVDRASYIERLEVSAPDSAPGVSKSVVLPHSWDDEFPAWSGEAHYHMTLPQAVSWDSSGATPWAIYFQRIGARYRVSLNGSVIAVGEWDTPGYVDTSAAPQLVDIPAQLLAPPGQPNSLVIEVAGRPLRKSGLSAFYIGPREALNARYSLVHWWQVTLTWMLAACSAVLAVLAWLMFVQNGERAFGFLAAASASWVLRLVLTPLEQTGLSFELWFYLHKLSLTFYAGFLYLFLWDLFGHHEKRLRLLGSSLLWLGPVWLALTLVSERYLLYSVWSGWTAFVASMGLLLMLKRARWGLDSNQRLLLVAGSVTVICGVRDFAMVALDFPGAADLRWMPLGSLVFMLTMAIVLVRRVAHYVVEIGHLNQTLEERVKLKETELRAAFDRLRQVERDQVVEQERQRMTRDMHDGLGSHLVQTLNLARSCAPQVPVPVIDMLVHALDELRMTLDSMEPMEGDLPAILGTLRRRIGPALQAAGLELDWQVEEVPAIGGLEAGATLHLFRFLQEVFANIIRHAQARRVSVRTWVDEGCVVLSVADDGRGLGQGFRVGGQGLYNIRLRATAIGASVAFIDNQPGTRVEFRFASGRA